jgi:AcrR family transcriptional regulator
MATAGRTLLRKEERQESIVAAAARAFAATGFASTSMEDVAAAAGITKLIVYRHFESKEELYRAVLQRVSDRLAEEFIRGVTAADRDGAGGDGAPAEARRTGLGPRPGERQGVGVRALLTVAREDQAAFTLLWRHATREPQFADYAHDHRERAVGLARTLLRPTFSDPMLVRWGAETVVSYLVEAVLHWLDDGDAQRDDEMIQRTTDGLHAVVAAWSGS